MPAGGGGGDFLFFPRLFFDFFVFFSTFAAFSRFFSTFTAFCCFFSFCPPLGGQGVCKTSFCKPFCNLFCIYVSGQNVHSEGSKCPFRMDKNVHSRLTLISFFSLICSPKERKKKAATSPKGVARGLLILRANASHFRKRAALRSGSEQKKKPPFCRLTSQAIPRLSPRRTGSRARRRLVRRAQASDHRRGRSEHRRRRRRNAKTLKARPPRACERICGLDSFLRHP